jgi:DNA primase
MSTEAFVQPTWDNAGDLKGPLIEAYYAWRGLAVPETKNLRFAALLKHASGASYPAIVARAENAEGVMTGVQRSFLALDGSGKAPVPKKQQKMSFGRIKGSTVRLAELIDGVPLLIGEGVETVQTVMQATRYPGWATFGTSGLKASDLPDNAKDVILLGENDGGKNAAAIADAASDLKRKGVRIRIAMPLDGFKDHNSMVVIEPRPLRPCARRSRTPRILLTLSTALLSAQRRIPARL